MPNFDSKKSQPRDNHGRFESNDDPPVVQFAVNNPVNYLKRWWARVIGNEGIDVKFRIHPLTAIAIAVVLGSAGFGIGRLSVPEPLIKYVPFLASPTPVATLNPWRETAYTGILRFTQTSKTYLLEVGQGETISLRILPNVDLSKFIGRRILAIGKVNDITKTLEVSEATDLEILPNQAIVVPVVTTPIPTI